MLESQAWSSWYSETRRYCGIALPLSDDGLTISETGRRFKFMYNIYKMFEPCTQFEGCRTCSTKMFDLEYNMYITNG